MQQYQNYYKHIKDLYNSTDKDTIKNNLRSILKHNSVQPKALHTLLSDLSIHSIYSYYKNNPKYSNIPELVNLFIIAEYLNIDITDFFI